MFESGMPVFLCFRALMVLITSISISLVGITSMGAEVTAVI